MRIATDIGGTFTDLVAREGDGLRVVKTSTTPPHFEQGIADALERLRAASATGLDAVEVFLHGTTVVINTIAERAGARVGLITTRGFRDVLEIGRANRPDLYNFYYEKPAPLVPRYLRREVDERRDYSGAELRPLDEEGVRAAARALRDAGCAAIAVAFLHSYADPSAERRAAALVAEECPGMHVTVSAEVTREWREYERTSTAVLNAYVQPRATAYLAALEGTLRAAGLGAARPAGSVSAFVMQSNGGATTLGEAARAPINLLESGPVAGVFGAAVLGRGLGIGDLISLDVGGTTAKCSLVRGGEVTISTDYRVEQTPRSAGYPVRVPVVDIVEIGAGGGSLAWRDDAGAPRVGPRSAGALPGPVCYGRGNAEPTVTDAALVAGRIDAQRYLGGHMAVDAALARDALERFGAPLGLDADATALGILRLANAHMIAALGLVSVQRGHDPRAFTLVASGGGGALHAAELAAELRIARVLIPPLPAVFSAWGMLVSDLRRDVVRTRVLSPAQADPQTVDAVWSELEDELARFFHDEGLVAGAAPLVTRRLELRYGGQEHTVAIPAPAGASSPATLAALYAAFHAEHERRYGYRLDSPVEIVTFHATALARIADGNPLPAQRGQGRVGAFTAGRAADESRALLDQRGVLFAGRGRVRTPVYERAGLAVGCWVEGPAIVEEDDTTIVVPPGQRCGPDGDGNLWIETGGAS